MATRSKKNLETLVFVEVLQNGELLSQTNRPFHKPGKIFLSSNPESELTAPFYPLPTDIQLINITRRGAEVDLDPNWEGFTTYNGKIEEISSNQRTNYTHIMKEGDYGSIAYNDLRILIRIGKERPKKKELARPSREYHASLFGIWFATSLERKILLVSLVASLWIFGGILYGFLNRPDDRPTDVTHLRPEYTLPFIHPMHLTHLPEALQNQYQRNNVIGSAFRFYKNFAATIMNFPVNWNSVIFRNTYDRYQEIYQDHHLKIQGLLDQQKSNEEQFLAKQASAVLRIPTVHGESFQGSLLRVKDKIEILHQNFEMSLQSRIATTQSFKRESEYDYELYRKLPKQNAKQSSNATGIKSLRSREQAMYRQVQGMAKYSAFHQERMKQFREPLTFLTPENASPITIAEKSQVLSFLKYDHWQDLNQKLALLNASEFDARRPQIIKEPLLGEIEPHLVKQLIEKHRFELQLCFELALRRNQNLSGKMEWQWRLDSGSQL
ncbi:MAG: hypothetical protein ACOH5I_05575 [Oligoflexus sp.]